MQIWLGFSEFGVIVRALQGMAIWPIASAISRVVSNEGELKIIVKLHKCLKKRLKAESSRVPHWFQVELYQSEKISKG